MGPAFHWGAPSALICGEEFNLFLTKSAATKEVSRTLHSTNQLLALPCFEPSSPRLYWRYRRRDVLYRRGISLHCIAFFSSTSESIPCSTRSSDRTLLLSSPVLLSLTNFLGWSSLGILFGLCFCIQAFSVSCSLKGSCHEWGDILFKLVLMYETLIESRLFWVAGPCVTDEDLNLS